MCEAEQTTLEKILAAARQEFLEKGYASASLRTIVKSAGVTTGALYGYFHNKQDLFAALVAPCYEHMLDLYRDILAQFSALPPEEQAASMSAYTARGMTQMCSYLYDHHDTFKLILCCAQGTAYDHLVRDMARMDLQATHDFSTAAALSVVPSIHPTLEQMLTGGMFSAFFALIVHDVPREEAPAYLSQLLAFYEGGWSRILGF